MAILPLTNPKIKTEERDGIEEQVMARYKHIDTSPQLLAVDLSKQQLSGSRR